MPEQLNFSEIQELFNELNSEISLKDEFIQAKRAWSSNTGRKLANSSNVKKRDQFKRISKQIRIMDHGFDESIELIFEKFSFIAENLLANENDLETEQSLILLNQAGSELNLSINLTDSFIIRYKKSKQKSSKLDVFLRFLSSS